METHRMLKACMAGVGSINSSHNDVKSDFSESSTIRGKFGYSGMVNTSQTPAQGFMHVVTQ